MNDDLTVEPFGRTPDAQAATPVILSADAAGTDRCIDELASRGRIFSQHDTIAHQLLDLARGRHPSDVSPQVVDREIAACLGGQKPATFGNWVFYPWSGQLVHLLPRPLYRELRSDRNRNKITAAEQDVLHEKTIGVVGLSVGQASAVTMVLEGIGGRFRLGDFDELSLSNLNRLRASSHDLGVNKAVLAARQMTEIDPYLEIEIFPAGIDSDNIDAFMAGDGAPLDLVVEECDDFPVKLLIRQEARRRGIPVVMDTNDRGLLDIERFDLEPQRPLLHGMVGNLDAGRYRQLSPDCRRTLIRRIIGGDGISPRLRQSLPEIGRTLSTWPQLGSGVALGAALVTEAARSILLDHHRISGRFTVDLEAALAVPCVSADS